MDPSRVIDSFPAPSFRGAQKRTLRDIRDVFADSNDVALVRASTGSGKSFLARAIAGSAATVDETSPAQATDAYYTTPQVSQLNDVTENNLLSNLKVIRGRSNYSCIIRGEEDMPIGRAPCARRRGFDCSVRHRCPYLSDRTIVSNRRIVAVTLVYFIQTTGSDVFRKRDVVVVDEAHGLAEWTEMYATVDLKPRTVPVWDNIGIPDVVATSGPIGRASRFTETLVGVCKCGKDELPTKSELMPRETARHDRLQELADELNWFVEDYRDPQSPTTQVVDQHDDEESPIAIKPLDLAKYLKHTVWDRGNRFALLSTTILNKAAFCRSVGLDPSKVTLVNAKHTFPVENWPLYDVTRGRMTCEHRDETLPKITRLVIRLMAKRPDEKGLIHCHSYAIQAELRRRLAEIGPGNHVRGHDRNDRNAELETWKTTDRPEVFLSMKTEEALGLNGDLCRQQVLCKASYLNANSSRVARRLEDGQWVWYHRAALQTVIQTCGRVMRVPDDYGDTYVADSSLLQLFGETWTDMPDQFAAQTDRMTKLDLPEFDPVVAGGRGSDAGSAAGGTANLGDSTDRSRGASGSGSNLQRGSTRGSRSARSRASGSGGMSSGGSNGRKTGGLDGSADDSGRSSHSLSDMWGERLQNDTGRGEQRRPDHKRDERQHEELLSIHGCGSVGR